MTGSVVQARVRRRLLLRSRLKEQDSLVLVAAEQVDVASTLEVEALLVAARTGDDHRNRARVPCTRAGDIVARTRVDAMALVGEIATWRRTRCGIGVWQARRQRQALLVRRPRRAGRTA